MYRCDACGCSLPLGTPKAKIGIREFCGPDHSPCHTLGLRSASWTLSEAEARALLDEAIAA
jgi:hypothetical protein